MEIQTHIQHQILILLVISVIFLQLAINTLCTTLCLAPVKISKHRSSYRRCSVRKSVIRKFEKFTGKHLCQGLFFNKIAGLRQKRLWHWYFPVNFEKFLRTPFSQTTSGPLPPKAQCEKIAFFVNVLVAILSTMGVKIYRRLSKTY